LKQNDIKYHTIGTALTSYRNIVETRNKINTRNTHILDRSLFCLGTGASIKCDGVKPFYNI